MKSPKFNSVFKNRYVQVFFIALFIFLLIPMYLPAASYLCESEAVNINGCLDASWVLSLHWAIQKNLIFGKDYIFTYGPLGFLGTRTALGFSHLYFLISDLFIIVNLTFILNYALHKFNNFQVIIFSLIIVYTVSGGIGMYADQIVFTLLLISIFWLNYSLERSKIISLTLPVIITSLLFYIKVNISLVSLILFNIYLVYFIFSNKENRTGKILYGASVPLIIFLLSFFLNTNIFGYIAGGLSLVDGYNDAMSIKLVDLAKYLPIAILVISVFAISLFSKFSFLKNNSLLFITFCIFSFVLFKQSFVRSDLHIAIFFTYFPALCGILVIFYKKLSAIQTCIIACICSVCLISGLSLTTYPNLTDRLNYYDAVFYPNNIEERYAKNFDRFKLPAEVTEIIGSKSVDIIPWNVAYLYFNNLNYNPRPIIQSYSAYTPYLINLNKQKYESDSAPDFVLFSHTSIDWRYPLFDDQEVKLSLIKDYSCLGIYNTQGNDFLLFQRSPNHATINFSTPTEESIKFNEDYSLKDTNKSYFINIDVGYTLFGRAVRNAYKPFPIVIIFSLENGTERQYRAIIPILKNGVLINPLIEEPRDFFNFVNGNPFSESKKIKSFRIELDAPSNSASNIAKRTFNTDIKLSISEVLINKKN